MGRPPGAAYACDAGSSTGGRVGGDEAPWRRRRALLLEGAAWGAYPGDAWGMGGEGHWGGCRCTGCSPGEPSKRRMGGGCRCCARCAAAAAAAASGKRRGGEEFSSGAATRDRTAPRLPAAPLAGNCTCVGDRSARLPRAWAWACIVGDGGIGVIAAVKGSPSTLPTRADRAAGGSGAEAAEDAVRIWTACCARKDEEVALRPSARPGDVSTASRPAVGGAGSSTMASRAFIRHTTASVRRAGGDVVVAGG